MKNPLGSAAKVAKKKPKLKAVKNDKSASPPKASDEWEKSLTRNKDGSIRASSGNGALILANAPEWRRCLEYDEMHERPVFSKSPPPVAGFEKIPKPGPVKDHHTPLIAQRLELDHGFALTDANATSAVLAASRQSPFHPVRDYLDGLEWDGEARVRTWLIDLLGAKDTALHREVGLRWLISAVARIFKPGCKADHMLVFEGPQGIGKSTTLRILAVEDAWFRDSIESFEKKDARIALRGTWIVEVAELDAMNYARASAAKAFLTTTTDRYRPPYGRLEQEVPRRCVFAGSVNDHQWLRDDTGGRRYWPVEIPGRIDTDKLSRVRDQLWAEAVQLYRQDEPWHLVDEDAIQEAKTAQEARTVTDPWEDQIRTFVGGYTGEIDELTTAAILQNLGIEPRDRKTSYAMRVGGVMLRLGYRKNRKHGKPRYWEPDQ